MIVTVFHSRLLSGVKYLVHDGARQRKADAK